MLSQSFQYPLPPNPHPLLLTQPPHETFTYFSSDPLNRLSFLRSNHQFLRACLPHARFSLFKNLDPLVAEGAGGKVDLVHAKWGDVSAWVGENRFEESFREVVEKGGDVGRPVILFIGMDVGWKMEGKATGDEGAGRFTWGEWSGRPYFAVDVSRVFNDGEEDDEEVAEGKKGEEGRRQVREFVARGGEGWKFTRIMLDERFGEEDAGLVSFVRMVLDWNQRNQFCASCGSRTISIQGGMKRDCPPNGKKKPCITRKGIHNIAFPRTDPSVIMAILNFKGDKILLGRQPRYPPSFFSILSGFVDPSESLESCVRRETWEESGVQVGRVVMHSSQPWPYPASLMIGCIGHALEGGETIRIRDKEMEACSWVGIEEVREALARKQSGPREKPPVGWKEGMLRLPPKGTIVWQLLKAIVDGVPVPGKGDENKVELAVEEVAGNAGAKI